jgi:hypothetical protein
LSVPRHDSGYKDCESDIEFFHIHNLLHKRQPKPRYVQNQGEIFACHTIVTIGFTSSLFSLKHCNSILYTKLKWLSVDLRALWHKQIFAFITKGRFSCATNAKDFNLG